MRILTIAILILVLFSCSTHIFFDKNNLDIVNRDIVSINNSKNSLELNRKKESGMAIIKDLKFENGVINCELKGENNPGRSFVGIAFNIQNDSTYEDV